MNKTSKYIQMVSVLFIMIWSGSTQAQGTLADYQRAERFMHFNIYDLVKNLQCTPHWIKNSGDFWYKTQTEKGYEYRICYTKNGKTEPVLNHQKLAQKLQEQSNKIVNPDSLPIKNLKIDPKHSKASFRIDTVNYIYHIRGNKLEVKAAELKVALQKNESLSPDGKWIAFVKTYNLYLRNIETGKEHQLTTNGQEKYDYASPLSWYKQVDLSKGDTYDPSIYVSWAPNSKKFIATRIDRRQTKNLYLYQYMPDEGMRAKIWSYERALPGEPMPKLEYFVFDVEGKSKTDVDMEPMEDIWPGFAPTWTSDSKWFYLGNMERYYKQLNLIFIDPTTGTAKIAISEKAKTMIEYQMIDCEIINNGEKVLCLSERDGWNHIYLYDQQSGELIKQITKGKYVVRDIVHVDEENQLIFFVAGGKELNRDPYFRHLYKTSFNGGEPTLLTPENADHDISISPDKQVFVDNYSRVDMKPKAVLRELATGKKIATVQESDISKLEATGWKHPVRFTTLARDGKTEIFGILQYPTHFDSTKNYPIIDNSYSGPQAVNCPKKFSGGIWNNFLPLAEAGFIIMRIDGLGTAMRSKAFHDVSYKNLGDIGAPDHMAAIRQLAKKHKFIDTTRVGIYGHSAGGYDAARAVLTHPDFYKAGVAAAGNHDHRMAKAWWPEQYMGELGPHYQEQSNLTVAKNLKGQLLLAHGAMDNNVNPACTYRLAGELIKHNKDFELLITPNDDHGELWHNKYFIRKRMDFFVRHLLNTEPPKAFQLKDFNK